MSRLIYLSPYSPGRNHGELAWEHLKAAAAAALNHFRLPFAFGGFSRTPRAPTVYAVWGGGATPAQALYMVGLILPPKTAA
jgi:hypothetical protein